MLDELIGRWGAEAPERPVLISERGSLSYRGCQEQAAALAGWMRREEIARLGIAVDDPEATVIALVAAAMAGVEPCVYPRDLDRPAIDRLAARVGHETVLTGSLPEGFDDPGAQVPSSEDSPVMILTTGTTGEPKAVRHDWRRLARSVRRPDQPDGSRWLLAYNLNQFAGIQVLLHVLVSGTTLIAPRSARARDVIEALGSHSVTHVSATPTFWQLLIGALDREGAAALSLRQITLGGEAASQSLLDRLAELFPAARITHVYAGTEIGSVISVHDGLAGVPASVLDRSQDSPVAFRVVDDELQVRSNVGMLGYYAKDSDEPREGWQATGDLVEIRDGRIHFVGRTTEIINVGGAKVGPLPIEEVACATDGVKMAAAYGRPSPVTGEIVALDVVAAPGADEAALEGRLREAFRALPRPSRPRRIRFVESLETSGHKVLRGAGR